MQFHAGQATAMTFRKGWRHGEYEPSFEWSHNKEYVYVSCLGIRSAQKRFLIVVINTLFSTSNINTFATCIHPIYLRHSRLDFFYHFFPIFKSQIRTGGQRNNEKGSHNHYGSIKRYTSFLFISYIPFYVLF